jgi:MFS family permease
VRSFGFYWCSRVASTLANQMFAVAVSWQIYQLTGSAFALGMIGLVQFVPTVALVLASGHVADRYERRYVGSACQFFAAVTVAVIALSVVTRTVNPALLFVCVFLIGLGRSFEAPSVMALLPNLVTRDQLSRATANATSASNVAAIAGPALGGVLYALGAQVVYLTVVALLIVAAIALPLTRPVSREVAPGRQTWQTLFAGFSFVAHDRVVLGAISLDLFAVLMGGATALLPIYARDVFHTGAWGLGLLRAAPAAGALLTTIALGLVPLRRRVGPLLFATVGAYGVATIVFAVSRSFALSLFALGASGLFDAISRVIRATLVQMETPDAVRGRVTAVTSLFTASSGQLGQVESGFVAAAIGAIPSAVVGGVGSIVVAIAWLVMFPEVRRIDEIGKRPV